MTDKQRARTYYRWTTAQNIGDGGVGEPKVTPEVADKVARQLGYVDGLDGILAGRALAEGEWSTPEKRRQVADRENM